MSPHVYFLRLCSFFFSGDKEEEQQHVINETYKNVNNAIISDNKIDLEKWMYFIRCLNKYIIYDSLTARNKIFSFRDIELPRQIYNV